MRPGLLLAFVAIAGQGALREDDEAGALAGSLGLLAAAVAFSADRTDLRARRLFLGSITYLPLLWVLLIVNRL